MPTSLLGGGRYTNNFESAEECQAYDVTREGCQANFVPGER